jgi:hypothetical protein
MDVFLFFFFLRAIVKIAGIRPIFSYHRLLEAQTGEHPSFPATFQESAAR